MIAVSLGTAFSESQFVDLLGYEDAVRAKVLDEPPVTARRLMDVHALDGDITVFYAYDADLRGRILQLEQDQAVSALLRKKYDGETIAVLLSDDNLLRLGSASDAVVSALGDAPDADTLARYAVFVADSQSNGNGFILEGLLEMGEGELTPELLDTGEEANRLLTDSRGHFGRDHLRACHFRFQRDIESLLCRACSGLEAVGSEPFSRSLASGHSGAKAKLGFRRLFVRSFA